MKQRTLKKWQTRIERANWRYLQDHRNSHNIATRERAAKLKSSPEWQRYRRSRKGHLKRPRYVLQLRFSLDSGLHFSPVMKVRL